MDSHDQFKVGIIVKSKLKQSVVWQKKKKKKKDHEFDAEGRGSPCPGTVPGKNNTASVSIFSGPASRSMSHYNSKAS